MSEDGNEAARHGRDRSGLRLADVAKMAAGTEATAARLGAGASHGEETAAPPEHREPWPVPVANVAAEPAVDVASRRRAFAEMLGKFRRTAVLVPLGEGGVTEDERGFLTADLNGFRFILAFSDEQALARYAVARGGAAREWAYQSVLGARLLDVAVPAAGVPCGVALDCADGQDGMVFPPVRGIVPDAVAVDIDVDGDDPGGAA
ncbi:hypothetical protein [Streptomyces tremellae]|uniref:SseB protein N-terminal domain-containing protein n=1 Tax=Streptomyces tremellae TaxID=1124239 RepID=A0ABP7F8V0_9ACTN